MAYDAEQARQVRTLRVPDSQKRGAFARGLRAALAWSEESVLIDLIDLFDLYQNARIDSLGSLQADTSRRVTDTNQRIKDLEMRYERMRLVNAALWELLKAHTGLVDSDLKQYIERVDLADGKLDGKIDRRGGAMDCPHCSRRILKSAAVCPWCTKRIKAGDAFLGT